MLQSGAAVVDALAWGDGLAESYSEYYIVQFHTGTAN